MKRQFLFIALAGLAGVFHQKHDCGSEASKNDQ